MLSIQSIPHGLHELIPVRAYKGAHTLVWVCFACNRSVRNGQSHRGSLVYAALLKPRRSAGAEAPVAGKACSTCFRRATYNETMPDTPADAAPFTFEAGLEQLEAIVKEMESGDLPLERALELFERGTKLSDACRKQLEDAETRIEILTRRAGEMQPQLFRPEK